MSAGGIIDYRLQDLESQKTALREALVCHQAVLMEAEQNAAGAEAVSDRALLAAERARRIADDHRRAIRELAQELGILRDEIAAVPTPRRPT